MVPELLECKSVFPLYINLGTIRHHGRQISVPPARILRASFMLSAAFLCRKAREGKWNGGFAPYGYKLVEGYLEIAEDEAEVIRIIYDKYVNTTMGATAVAAYLNEHGYEKKKRQNNTLDMFSAHFIKSVLDNPIYCGKLAYGRRKNEKVAGTRNQYHIPTTLLN